MKDYAQIIKDVLQMSEKELYDELINGCITDKQSAKIFLRGMIAAGKIAEDEGINALYDKAEKLTIKIITPP